MKLSPAISSIVGSCNFCSIISSRIVELRRLLSYSAIKTTYSPVKKTAAAKYDDIDRDGLTGVHSVSDAHNV